MTDTAKKKVNRLRDELDKLRMGHECLTALHILGTELQSLVAAYKDLHAITMGVLDALNDA